MVFVRLHAACTRNTMHGYAGVNTIGQVRIVSLAGEAFACLHSHSGFAVLFPCCRQAGPA